MMGRPPKNNADWFRHDADMRNDEKIQYLRTKHGMEGYGVWCFMLEVLTSSDYFTIEWNAMREMCYSGDFRIEKEKLNMIIDDCLSLELLQLEDGKLRCDKLSLRMSTLTEKRENKRSDIKQKKVVLDAETPVSDAETPVSDVQKPHTRLEYTRLEQTREEISKNNLSISQPPATADEREREAFLEIFFFKGYADPQSEVEKFVAHYEGVGWIDANGRPIKSRLAIAKNWEQKKSASLQRPALARQFLELWRSVYERLKIIDPQNAYKALDFVGVRITSIAVIPVVTKETEMFFVQNKTEILTAWRAQTSLKFNLQIITK